MPPSIGSGPSLAPASPARLAALAALLLLAAPAAAPALAQDQVPDGEELALLGFRDHDQDNSGTVSEAELMAFGDLAFTSMDADESGGVDEAEFVSWGWGHESLADAGEQMQAYRTSQRMVADILDRDNDGAFSPAELRDGLASSFAYADLDGDGALTEGEYLEGLIFNIALRNALTAEAG
jgi:Ca2+-binding EF-hand superfamily protein